MSDMNRVRHANRRGVVLRQPQEDFHHMPKHLWHDEVVRVIKGSKGSRRRLAEWSTEITV